MQESRFYASDVVEQSWYLHYNEDEHLYMLGEKVSLTNGEQWGHVTWLTTDSFKRLCKLVDDIRG